MRVLFRRAAVITGAAAVVISSAAGIASAGGAPVLGWSSPATPPGAFGTVAAGSTTAQTFTLTNSGGSASAALRVTVTGPAFTLQADTCTGTSLGPRKSCTVTVDYTPGAGGGTDTGTLTAAGVKAAATASLNLSGTVPDIVTVTWPGNQTSTAGVAVSLPVTGSDSASGQTLTWSAPGLPAGLSINPATGQITGTPTTAGTYPVAVTATDGTGASGSASFTWTVNPDIVTVTSSGDQASTAGVAVSLPVTGSDSDLGQTLTWSAAGLPPGLSIDSHSGLITGTPSTAGTSNVTVTATDATAATGSTSFTWTVNPDIVTVTSPGNQKSTIGVAASLQMTGSDTASLQTLTWTAPRLPAGLSINSATGQITGTPTSAGTFSVTVTATDPVTGTSGSASFTWTVGVTVSVTITGEPNTGCGACAIITIDAAGLSGSGENTCSSADSCSLWVHSGDAVDVSLVSPVVGPFTYSCGGSASQTAAGPNPEGDYTGACQATVTSDYNVTVSF